MYVKHRGKVPSWANLVGSMIVLQIKRDPKTGEIDKYKARLVALGNQQSEDSYQDIKSGTARSASVKLLASIQAKTGAFSMVLDIKGAYLKSSVREELNENLFLRLPDGDIVRLKKYLYGLKQAGYEWQQNVSSFLAESGYLQSEADPLVFSHWVNEDFIIMSLHVDDFYVISSKTSMLDNLYESLRAKYGDVSLKDGDLLAYLGMQISVDHELGNITLSQPAYVQKLIDLYLQPIGTLSNRVVRTPMGVVNAKRPDDKVRVDQRHYLRLVGALNFLAQFTRPDILFAVSCVAQRCASPTRGDLRKVIRIFRYLSATIDYGITFSPGPVDLHCYVDAAHNVYEDGKGHYGYSFSLGQGDGTFFAKSKKFKLVTLSSTESEYVALCEAARETVWLRRLLDDIGFPQRDPTILMQDNLSTIEMVHGHHNFQASKHVNPKYHYTGELVDGGEIMLRYIKTDNMIADVLTKALSSGNHHRLSSALMSL